MKKILLLALGLTLFSCVDNKVKRDEVVTDLELKFKTSTIDVYKVKIDSVDYLIFNKHNGGIFAIPLDKELRDKL